MKWTSIARRYIERHPHPARARLVILADEMGISAPTLHRYLKQEGTTWSRIHTAELCRRFNQLAGLQWQDIAKAIGYADTPAAIKARRRAYRRNA